MTGVDHLDLVVSDLGVSLDFYRALLGPLGFTREVEIVGERGERVVYLSGTGGAAVSLRERQSDSHPVPYDRYGVGLHHLAFAAGGREQVDERAAWLRQRGATIESGPEEYGYVPGYYAVFFYDPDGIKLEIVHRPAAAAISAAQLRAMIRDVPDFPRRGIVFRDVTPLLADPRALRSAMALLAEQLADLGKVDLVVGAEARGFLLGPAIAARLRAGFVPARRPGKLPWSTESVEYQLEYGLDALHVHSDAFEGGARVVVHDDLIATGGTAAAIGELVEKLGGEVVGYSFLVELADLGGRERLGAPVRSLIEIAD